MKLKIKKMIISCFLCVLIGLMIIDATPETSLFHKAAKDKIDYILDITGLWQGTWTLFSPSPDKVNIKVSWICEYSNGTATEEESPRWINMNNWQRWAHFRYMEYFDNVRNDSNQAAWRSLARFVAKKCNESQAVQSVDSNQIAKVTAVKLFRHWSTIREFSLGEAQDPRPQVNFKDKYLFFEEKF